VGFSVGCTEGPVGMPPQPNGCDPAGELGPDDARPGRPGVDHEPRLQTGEGEPWPADAEGRGLRRPGWVDVWPPREGVPGEGSGRAAAWLIVDGPGRAGTLRPVRRETEECVAVPGGAGAKTATWASC
jgi:hypothetical protein